MPFGSTKSSMITVAPGRAIQVVREASRSNRAHLRSTPQAYPEVDPSLRITRWHGMATAILFAAQAAGDGAHRVRRPDPLRELGITDRRAERDVLKRLPDPLLKRGAANVERQIETDLRRLHAADHARDHRLVVPVSADQTRLGESILKKPLGVIPEKNCNNALPARSDQDRAEGALTDREPDLLVRPSGAILRSKRRGCA